jgi:hypothetical protein
VEAEHDFAIGARGSLWALSGDDVHRGARCDANGLRLVVDSLPARRSYGGRPTGMRAADPAEMLK